MFVEPQVIAQVLGGEKTLGVPVRQLEDLEKLVLDGMPFAAIQNAFKLMSPKTDQNELHVLLHMVFRPGEKKRYEDLKRAFSEATSTKTSKSKIKLRTNEGERAERLARIYALAKIAIGDDQGAREFLFSKHAMLNGASPLQKLETEIGAHEVEAILNAAIYGLPS